MKLDSYLFLHGSNPLGPYIAGMIGMEYKLHASPFIFTIQLRIPVFMAYEDAAPDSFYIEYAEMISGTVMTQFSGLACPIARAKHFIVAVKKLSAVGNNIQTVVRLVVAGQSMGGSHNNPQLQFACKLKHLWQGSLERFPGKSSVRIEVMSDIARKACFREMHYIGTAIAGLFHLEKNIG